MKHIGFIMDGNRRWAKSHALDTFFGHKKGADVVDPILQYCSDRGVEVITFWCLAKKNIQERSERELTYLYDLFIELIETLTPKLIRENIRLEAIGNINMLPEGVQKALNVGIDATKAGVKSVCVLALGYGGQDEIVRGVKRCLAEGVDPNSLDEKSFSKYLETGKYPAPDLIVRTGGDIRLSGYFLYMSEYSEYAFTDTFWPDFAVSEVTKIFEDFEKRKRNFGK